MHEGEIQDSIQKVDKVNEASKPQQTQPSKVKQRGKLGENRTETISLNTQNLQLLNSILGTLPENSGIDNASKLFVYFMDSYLNIATIQANSKALHENSSKQQDQVKELLTERDDLYKQIRELTANIEKLGTKPEVEKTKTIPPIQKTSVVNILYPGLNG